MSKSTDRLQTEAFWVCLNAASLITVCITYMCETVYFCVCLCLHSSTVFHVILVLWDGGSATRVKVSQQHDAASCDIISYELRGGFSLNDLMIREEHQLCEEHRIVCTCVLCVCVSVCLENEASSLRCCNCLNKWTHRWIYLVSVCVRWWAVLNLLAQCIICVNVCVSSTCMTYFHDLHLFSSDW